MRTKKILIVDDEPNIILSLDYLVRKNGFEPFIARNGTEALAIARSEIPDLILLDIMMPDIDGYQVCRSLKKDALFEHTKIVFLSAKSKREDIELGLEAGADSYFTKPFSTKQIMQEILKLLVHNEKNNN